MGIELSVVMSTAEPASKTPLYKKLSIQVVRLYSTHCVHCLLFTKCCFTSFAIR